MAFTFLIITGFGLLFIIQAQQLLDDYNSIGSLSLGFISWITFFIGIMLTSTSTITYVVVTKRLRKRQARTHEESKTNSD